MQKTSNNNEPIELFYSYSHKDELLRDELEKHLSILKRQGVIAGWHDRKITPGAEWGQNIDKYLATAHIVLLLISSDFLASDYCYEKEMQSALARHNAGEARVIPVILRTVDWQDAPFGKLQALPKDAKPVVSWESRDEAFTSVVQGIRQAIKDLSPVTQKSSSQNISELLKKFTLRPKKYAGQEFITDVNLEDSIYKINEDDAEAFNLTLGSAISRMFIIKPEMKYSDKLYADGTLADWLEDAPTGMYRLRVRLIYGTHEELLFNGVEKKHQEAGFQLIEVINKDSDAPV